MGEKKYTFVYWQYDGKQMGSFLIQKYDSVFIMDSRCPKYFKKEVRPNKNNEEIKKLAQHEKVKIKKCEQLELPIGVSHYLSTHKKKQVDISYCYEEFIKMFSSEKGTKPRTFIAKLLAVILSSYFIRGALEQKIVQNMYPIHNGSAALYTMIRRRKSDDEAYRLRQLCSSFMVSTTEKKSDKFKIKAPTVLPVNGERKILERAWLRPREFEGDFKWPAPYQDMAVMLDGRFFGKADMKDFLSINPWCTAIIYGNKVEHTRLCVELNGKDVLDQLEVDWNIDAVNNLIAEYIPFVYYIFEPIDCTGKTQSCLYEDIWREAGTYLDNYMENRPKAEEKMAFTERFKQRILLSALISFSDFLYRSCGISQNDAKSLKQELLTALLPGCCSLKHEETQVNCFPPFEEIIKELMSTKNMGHFYPIKKTGQVYLRKLPDGTGIWGYVKLYKDNKRNEKKINVSFFQDTLIRIVQEKYPQCGNFGEVLIDIRKRKPAYLHETPNIKCRTVEDGEKNTISGCRLILDELPISEETKDAFRQMLS